MPKTPNPTPHRRSTSPANPPQFFKIIHSTVVEKGILGIPKKFARKYGYELLKAIRIRVPNGEKWRVELKKNDGKIWLDKGWKEFASHYSIEFGHFIVFRYDGNSCFNVLIFDKSAAEIEYPTCYNISDDGGGEATFVVPKTEEILEEDDISVEILGEKEIQSNLHLQSCGGIAYRMKLRAKARKEGVECSKKRQPVVDETSAFERAEAFESPSPSFVVIIKPAHLSPVHVLDMPMAFVRSNLNKKQNIVSLCVSNSSQIWPCSRGVNQRKLCGGWRAFVGDNHLKLGDVCVFESVHGKAAENLLKVDIYRLNNDIA